MNVSMSFAKGSEAPIFSLGRAALGMKYQQTGALWMYVAAKSPCEIHNLAYEQFCRRNTSLVALPSIGYMPGDFRKNNKGCTPRRTQHLPAEEMIRWRMD